MTFDKWCKGNTKLTNSIIAGTLGVSTNYISMLRKGKRTPSNKLILAIKRYTEGHVPVTVWFDDK